MKKKTEAKWNFVTCSNTYNEYAVGAGFDSHNWIWHQIQPSLCLSGYKWYYKDLGKWYYEASPKQRKLFKDFQQYSGITRFFNLEVSLGSCKLNIWACKKNEGVEQNFLGLVIDWPWIPIFISLQEISIIEVFIHRITHVFEDLDVFSEVFVCVCLPVLKLFLLSQIPLIICFGMLGLVVCKPCFLFASWISARYFSLAEIFGSSIQHFVCACACALTQNQLLCTLLRSASTRWLHLLSWGVTVKRLRRASSPSF